MKTVKTILEPLTNIDIAKKIFFLKLTRDEGKNFRLLGGIFEPGRACKIKHSRIDRLIEQLEDSTANHTLLHSVILEAPKINTTDIALEVLNHLGITKESYMPMELTVGFPDSYITGFRFSIPRKDRRSAKVEILEILTWAQENTSSFKKHEMEKEKEIENLQYQSLIWKQEKRLEEELRT